MHKHTICYGMQISACTKMLFPLNKHETHCYFLVGTLKVYHTHFWGIIYTEHYLCVVCLCTSFNHNLKHCWFRTYASKATNIITIVSFIIRLGFMVCSFYIGHHWNKSLINCGWECLWCLFMRFDWLTCLNTKAVAVAQGFAPWFLSIRSWSLCFFTLFYPIRSFLAWFLGWLGSCGGWKASSRSYGMSKLDWWHHRQNEWWIPCSPSWSWYPYGVSCRLWHLV
jgi:hypothetical protein